MALLPRNDHPMTTPKLPTALRLLPALCCAAPLIALHAASGVVDKGSLRFSYDERGIAGLGSKDDPFGAEVTSPEQPLALTVHYKTAGGDWITNRNRFQLIVSPETNTLKYTLSDSNSPLRIVQTFSTDGATLDWNIDLENPSNGALTIGDLAINIPSVGPTGENPQQIFEHGFIKHQFISGHGSFLYFVRASGAGPFLIVTVRPGTKLEYFGGGGGRGGGGAVYIHSALTANNEKRGTWRQPNTWLTLGAAGAGNSQAHYAFRLQFAKTYDAMREVLFREGLFDIRAVPGMTVPIDLPARFALRTRASIEAIESEFPAATKISRLPDPQRNTCLFAVSFQRLGENRLTIVHDGGRKTYLEYFVTEPLETLIKKRSAFIIGRQQIHDPSNWWDGVFGPYDMKAKVVRTINDPDIFVKRMVYNLTCDDPGLCKAPYVAEKNVSFPEAKEIQGLEYYLEHFVWGKLQRTGGERPYPYGVYGTPNWYTDRDPARRKAWYESLQDPKGLADLSKEHVWRSYDYPHLVMLYYHLYEIATKYPKMSRYLDAAGYLDRAWQTARAFFTYPMQIYPEYYETYKWGLYNELVVLKLADALEREGFPDRASWLRAEWEKKVKYFVYDDPYPFRSEYAFDRTAFESSYALAKYGATHDMPPDTNLWFDPKLKKWYSHPSVKAEDSRAFMDRQLAAGLCVRGWLEASYYQLGADGGVSYMAAMGGWGILDYALDFAPKPADWLQLGYASYLSSWCLMNSGPARNNYGFWFPGQENDGAAGWQFISAKAGSAWMYSSYSTNRFNPILEPRGPWHYDGEIDLGFGGALRSAATIVTCDPVFGWFAYGGVLSAHGQHLSVIPRDGLRQRFDAILPSSPDDSASIRRCKMALDRDGFAAEKPVLLDTALDNIAFTLENRTKDKHTTRLLLSFPAGAPYEVTQDGQRRALHHWADWDYPWSAELQAGPGLSKIKITRLRPR